MLNLSQELWPNSGARRSTFALGDWFRSSPEFRDDWYYRRKTIHSKKEPYYFIMDFHTRLVKELTK